MISVEVISESKLWSKRIKKKDFFFNSILSHLPQKYKFNQKRLSLTLLLSNNQNIKRLNKKFRNKNQATDVLSFPFEKKLNIKNSLYIGDIIMSYEFMNKPKISNSLDFKNKVTKIFIHGFLHLLGYDHIKLKDFKEMFSEEEKIYQTIEKKIVKLV